MQVGQMPSRYNRIAYQTIIIETIILLNSNYDDLVLMK